MTNNLALCYQHSELYCISSLLQYETAVTGGGEEVFKNVHNKQVSMQQPIVSKDVKRKEFKLLWGAWCETSLS